MRTTLLFVPLALSIAAYACTTTGGDDTTTDGSTADAATEDAKSDGDACATGYTGAGCSSCAAGFHACGVLCEQDRANTPEAGCTQGCLAGGCAIPDYASATCTDAGRCDFTCNDTSFDKTDAGCACPPNQKVCGSVCAQCCNDSDCTAPHVGCGGGLCTICQPNWINCNNDLSDGCETSLAQWLDAGCG